MQIEQAFQRLNIVQDFIPVGHSNRPGRPLTPTYITVHNTDNPNPGADAAAHARYVKGQDAQNREVSWHYTVDDRVIYQSLPVNEVGWHAGAGNSKSIGIEICMHQGMNDARAYDRAALLVAVLALQNKIAVPDRIVQHNFWTGKDCPRVLRDRPDGWSGFLAKVQSALAQLQPHAVAKATPAQVIHAGDDDACEVLNRSAAKGASRKAAKQRRKKAENRKKTKPKAARSKSKSRKRGKAKRQRFAQSGGRRISSGP
jgi:N-acetylmuramoyl-L-alanine amidase CwlA